MMTSQFAPSNQPAECLPENTTVADRLDEAAQLLEARETNPYRVRAYRRAAQTIRNLSRSLRALFDAEGRAGLTKLPGIGDSIAHVIEQLLAKGTWPLLESLRGRSQEHAVLATVPGLGPKTAARIHTALGIETLAELEMAAYDGRLAGLPGIGRKRLRAVRESLAGRFHPPRVSESTGITVVSQPDVAELLSIDEEYRRKAAAGRLLQVAPLRFNPTASAWLPILHARREGRCYTALYSNTPRAHQLGMTHDWVVVYREGSRNKGRWTIVTSRRAPTQGRRVVRGREAECEAYYARLAEKQPATASLPGSESIES